MKNDKRFSKVIVVGHSEGSLIGMIAANQSGADVFVSIAGAGKEADSIIREQLVNQPQQVADVAFPILDSLANGKIVKDIPPFLFSLFRPSVQPYMISWMKYDPIIEINKLSIPILVLHGATDIQVSIVDAELLADANKHAELKIIENMNHILKESEKDMESNIATYNNPEIPVMGELVDSIVTFVNRN